jgi:predicted component of type VI protein secretion system
MPKLVYHDSDGIDKTVNLGEEPVIIGRASECEVQTHDAMVSRKHARIVWDGGGYIVEDLGSSNGVFLGTEKVQQAPFRPGDVVTCGSLVLRMVPTPSREMPVEGRRSATLGIAKTEPPPGLDDADDDEPQTFDPPVRQASAAASDSQRLKSELRRETERREQAEAALLSAEQKVAAADKAARELIQLRRRVEQLEAQGAGGGGLDLEEVRESVAVFNDALAQLKVALRAGADESELLTAPTQSVRLVRETIRNAMDELERARERLREMSRKLGLR